jgi:GntR family transcriptional regulator
MDSVLPLPKYHRLYLVLKERLRDGVYDHAVPTELQLMAEFGLARVTVRKALGTLAGEGLIERSAGRGTRRIVGAAKSAGFARQSDDAPPSRLTGLLDHIVEMSRRTTVRVVSLRHLAAPERVASALRLPPKSEVVCAVRVRSTKEGPVSLITAWVPQAHAHAMTRQQLARKPILLLLEEAGVAIGQATQTVSARQADVVAAEQLQVPVGSALLAVERTVYSQDDAPVQWLQGLYRPDRYAYEMNLTRVGEIDARVWIGREVGPAVH